MTRPRPINYFRHVSDDDRLTVHPEENADRLQRIIAAATCHSVGVEVATGTRCAELEDADGCNGRLRLRWDDAWPPVIHWSCPNCGDERSMWGWDESEYDQRPDEPIAGVPDGRITVALSHDAYDVVADKLSNVRGDPLARLGSGGALDPADPARVLVRGTVDEIELAMDRICYCVGSCLGAINAHDRIAAAWRQLDEAVAAGRADRHDRRDEQLRQRMRALAEGAHPFEPYHFPELLDGYAIVFPQRAEVLRAEFSTLDIEPRW